MVKRCQEFEDGSYVEWENREGVRYVEGDFIALVWIDFSPGFFSSGRIIRLSSLSKWYQKPNGYSEKIDEKKKWEIVDKVKHYFGKIKIEVEDDAI